MFKNEKYKLCPFCGNKLNSRVGRQPIPRQLRHKVFQRDGYRCKECGATNKQTTLHVDHIKPVSKGGTNDIKNLQTLCERCNLAKHTDEWEGGKIYSNSLDSNYLIQEKEKRYNNLSNSITYAQLQLLYDNFPNITSSRVEIIQYLVNNYSDNYIEQLLDKLEKEKKERLSNNLTDDQLVLFNNKYSICYNYSRTSVIDALSKKYTEDGIYQEWEILKNEQKEKEQLFKNCLMS